MTYITIVCLPLGWSDFKKEKDEQGVSNHKCLVATYSAVIVQPCVYVRCQKHVTSLTSRNLKPSLLVATEASK